MVRGCYQAVVLNDLLNTTANSAAVLDEILPVPYFVVKCHILYFYFALVSQNQRPARKTVLLAGARA